MTRLSWRSVGGAICKFDDDKPEAVIDGLPKGVYNLDFSDDGQLLGLWRRRRPGPGLGFVRNLGMWWVAPDVVTHCIDCRWRTRRFMYASPGRALCYAVRSRMSRSRKE